MTTPFLTPESHIEASINLTSHGVRRGRLGFNQVLSLRRPNIASSGMIVLCHIDSGTTVLWVFERFLDAKRVYDDMPLPADDPELFFPEAPNGVDGVERWEDFDVPFILRF